MAKINIVGTIEPELASGVIEDLLKLKKGKHDIYIASGGGASWFGNAIVDVILQLKDRGYTFNTYAIGVCASSAIPIFLTGNMRLVSDTCYILFHGYKLSCEMENDWELKADLKHSGKLDQIMYPKLLKNTKLTYDVMKKNIDKYKEWLITPDEAVELKLATGYLTKKTKRKGK